ncbi:hypothetical protein CRG98_003020 [Punica granatum]|uniref:Uncharacterized protein n=1 Tax=Punica granatum TaxID=22663 RepID=A0A2I0L799_PUNGR|nr:hypothetical protein CRG98_003020 [Punica granatum]
MSRHLLKPLRASILVAFDGLVKTACLTIGVGVVWSDRAVMALATLAGCFSGVILKAAVELATVYS